MTILQTFQIENNKLARESDQAEIFQGKDRLSLESMKDVYYDCISQGHHLNSKLIFFRTRGLL